MSQKLSFQKASENDLEQIVSMYRISFKKLYDRYHDEKTSPYKEPAEVIQRKIRQNSSFFFFITEDRVRVGLIRVMLDPKQPNAKISPLLVLPSFQGQKIAQHALAAIENLFPDIKTWYVDTIKQEDKLVHLYLKCGYKIIEDKNQNIQPGMDLVFFSKES
ncbi:GNAT family N-acetyltransferase [Oenococcus sicerae]|nr:GNAT family N-acetyltransferase [Oenococcus sicerae]QAS69989.1 GNAT family N-acetyltransferase [Oenococcus sicerae]